MQTVRLARRVNMARWRYLSFPPSSLWSFPSLCVVSPWSVTSGDLPLRRFRVSQTPGPCRGPTRALSAPFPCAPFLAHVRPTGLSWEGEEAGTLLEIGWTSATALPFQVFLLHPVLCGSPARKHRHSQANTDLYMVHKFKKTKQKKTNLILLAEVYVQNFWVTLRPLDSMKSFSCCDCLF